MFLRLQIIMIIEPTISLGMRVVMIIELIMLLRLREGCWQPEPVRVI